MAPKNDEAADGAGAPAPEGYFRARALFRAKTGVTSFHAFDEPLHEDAGFGIPQTAREAVIVDNRT